jgi:hypothetical protein
MCRPLHVQVILNPDPPKGRMHGLLFHSRYRSRLHYIAGCVA